ncbi:hypothetical protein C8R44DRAFT_755040 [Mycena epipterygia]|nr:hypothetical protein C8R44DRAFT_755040 [Mycena epipterygia]
MPDFGLKTDAHLRGNKYSTLGSMNAIAQLAWMPFSSYLLVRVPPRILMSVICSCWGIALRHGREHNVPSCGATAPDLCGTAPTAWAPSWPAPLHIDSNPKIHVYQMIFLFCGLMTVCTGPIVYWRLSNSVSEARFLPPEDRKKAVERVRANNTGTKPTDKYKWGQALEAVLEPKTWLFFAMALCLRRLRNAHLRPAHPHPHRLRLDKSRTSLLNTPFGGFQISSSSSPRTPPTASRWMKSLVTALLVLPVLAGLIIYKLHRPNEGGLLVGYYLLAFLYGANPLIVSWISVNTAGSTKKSVVLAGYNAASSVGNIVEYKLRTFKPSPLLFRDTDAPLYRHGLLSCIGIFAALAGSILCVPPSLLKIVNFVILNRLKQRQRIARGKPAVLHAASMDNRFRQRTQSQLEREKLEAASTGVALGDNALLDLMDWQNDEFVYVY